MSTSKFRQNHLTPTIFAKNYGSYAVISPNLKGVAAFVPPVQCCADNNLMVHGTKTFKHGGGGGGGGGRGCISPIMVLKNYVYITRYFVMTSSIPSMHFCLVVDVTDLNM